MDIASFPRFVGGDVRITVLPDVYQLHSSLIKNFSGYLRKLYNSHQVLVTPTLRLPGAPPRRVNMNLVSSPTHKYGALEIQDHENSHCAMEEMNPDSFPVWPPKTRRVWSNIFKICYNQDPNLDDGGYASILENCIALAEVGEEMEASIFVLQAIRTTLLGFDQQLYRLISEDPVSWVKLAVRIQSAPIFQESMVHLVGKWGLLEDQDRDSLPKSIKDLCNKKLEDLELTKKAVELKIVNLPRPRSDKHRQRGRNVIFAWMALNFYQQWLCESFVEGRNYRAPDGGASFYRAIAAGGDAYFDKLYHEISEFPSVEGQPESMKGLQEFENDLNELKKGIKEFVSDLLVNRAKYDPDSLGELPYLTCCKVEENEMPRPQKPETHGIDWKIDQGTQGMAMGNISAVSSQGNILPSEHMMMDFSNNATAFIINPELQISPEFSFDDFNAFNHQTTLDWDSTMPFSNAISTPHLSSLPAPTNGMYHTQHVQGNNCNMDIFGTVPITDADEYAQNNGRRAFSWS